MIKSKHLLDMENQRLRSLLSEIGEMAVEATGGLRPPVTDRTTNLISPTRNSVFGIRP